MHLHRLYVSLSRLPSFYVYELSAVAVPVQLSQDQVLYLFLCQLFGLLFQSLTLELDFVRGCGELLMTPVVLYEYALDHVVVVVKL